MGDGGVVGRFYIIWREERTMNETNSPTTTTTTICDIMRYLDNISQ